MYCIVIKAVKILLMHKANHLYDQLHPEHYDIDLDIKKDSLTFTGKVLINAKKVGRPSKRITLHQKELKITKASVCTVTKGQKIEIPIKRILHHNRYNEVRLHSETLLYPGEYEIKLSFTGIITKDMQGIYPGFFEHKNKKQTIIATQFESHHAREAFPCIDEPEAKATFRLTLNKNSAKDVYLSNTNPEIENENTITFAKTPRMSTYLLAFVMGPLHCVEATTKDGIVVRSWANIAQPKKMLTYSVEEAVKYLEFFTNYFDIPYPLEKCDQVALPDFDSGAMENWGLVTYREVALLSDSANPSITSEQYISLVIAHELSHQWFGNLVTMKWWDDLWLNESFASIMEYIALDSVHPDWKMWEHYTSSDVLATTSRDVYKDIQPVGVQVTDPDLIETLFDPGIVYAKGGRLIKMLREYIGEDAFKTGLKDYFAKYMYGNATRSNLWECLSIASSQDVSELMTPWLEQPGMPILTLKSNNKGLQLAQKRFLLDGEDDTSIWPIPILSNNLKQPVLLKKKAGVIQNTSKHYSIINDHSSGHYFVHYDDQDYKAFVTQEFTNMSIPTESRINILNDIYMLSRIGTTSITEGLEIVSNAQNEERDCVWILISRIIGAASQLTEGDDRAEEQIKALKLRLAHDKYKQLGWVESVSEDPNTKQLRQTIVSLMIASENITAISDALAQYNKYASIDKIPAELRSSILCAAVRHGDDKVIPRLISLYANASADIQIDITSALASTKKPDQAAIIMQKALGPHGFVRSQDVLRWLASFMRNKYTRAVAWDYMLSNWEWLYDTLKRSKAFDYFPVYLAAVVVNKEYQQKYLKFFEGKSNIKVLEQNIKVGKADIEARIAWRQRDEDKIMQWLAKNY